MKRFISVSCLIFLILVFSAPAFSAQTETTSIGIVGFESKTSEAYHQVRIVTDRFTSNLANSRTIDVFERERLESTVGKEIRMGASGLVDPETAAEIGKITGVKYLLTGSITELSYNEKVFDFIITQITCTARATMDIRLINTTTGKIEFAFSDTGTHSKTFEMLTDKYGKPMFGSQTINRSDFESGAIDNAVSILAGRIREAIGGESSRVLRVAGRDNITINQGSNTGVRKESLYLVYFTGSPIVDNGVVLGYEEKPIAVIKATDVSGAFSTCAIVPEGGNVKNVHKDDKIKHITRDDAKKYAGKLDGFNRPPAKSETYEELLKGGSDSAPKPSPGSSASKPAMASRIDIPGFNPDNSTDAKVIDTYGHLDSGARNMLRIRHLGTMNSYKGKKYKDAYAGFKEMADAYDGNYLAAYWAGVTAHNLKNNDEALEWLDKALSMNPNYKPAAEFKTKNLK